MKREQHINLITHESKLAGLEKNPKFPIEKIKRVVKRPANSQDYNIISNIDLSKHHYESPDKRPAPTDKKNVWSRIVNGICR